MTGIVVNIFKKVLCSRVIIISWHGSVFDVSSKPFCMRTINANQQRKALESYIKGLLQDFTNETDLHIQEIEIASAVDPDTNKRVITEVKAKLDSETLVPALP